MMPSVEELRMLVKGRWRYWRRMQRLSQARIARICGMSRSVVARWEDPSSAAVPDVVELTMICTAVQIKPDTTLLWLLKGARLDEELQ